GGRARRQPTRYARGARLRRSGPSWSRPQRPEPFEGRVDRPPQNIGVLMRTKKPIIGKKHFTVAEANAVLPLARSIVRDIAELANSLQDRYDRLTAEGDLEDANKEEMEHGLAQDQEKIREYVQEL